MPENEHNCERDVWYPVVPIGVWDDDCKRVEDFPLRPWDLVLVSPSHLPCPLTRPPDATCLLALVVTVERDTKTKRVRVGLRPLDVRVPQVTLWVYSPASYLLHLHGARYTLVDPRNLGPLVHKLELVLKYQVYPALHLYLDRVGQCLDGIATSLCGSDLVAHTDILLELVPLLRIVPLLLLDETGPSGGGQWDVVALGALVKDLVKRCDVLLSTIVRHRKQEIKVLHDALYLLDHPTLKTFLDLLHRILIIVYDREERQGQEHHQHHPHTHSQFPMTTKALVA